MAEAGLKDDVSIYIDTLASEKKPESLMRVRKRVGVLKGGTSSVNVLKESEQGSGQGEVSPRSRPLSACTRPMSAAAPSVSFHTAGARASAQALSQKSIDPQDSQSLRNKKAKEATALKLWHEWAEDALGPLRSEPSPAELSNTTAKLVRLERQAAAMAVKAANRLETSSLLRQSCPSGFSREHQWSAKELYKQSTYAAVREWGRAEGGVDGNSAPFDRSQSNQEASQSVGIEPLASHAMMSSLIQNGTLGSSSSPGPGGRAKRPQSAAPSTALAALSPRSRAIASALEASNVAWGGGGGGLSRSHSRPSRNPSRRHRPHSAMPQFQTPSVDVDPEAVAELQAEAEHMAAMLTEAQNTIETQSELEAQLRDTIDMLRARLHAQSTREVENQRRLQQHSQLKPLFEQLAEHFTFNDPKEVVARLNFLEGDKLGSFDQLIKTQEEVTQLQAKLEKAVKDVDLVRTQMSVDHIQSVAGLQQQNERLKEELEIMEATNMRLMERQEKLVSLQAAIMDLWSSCQGDPSFNQANSSIGGCLSASKDKSLGGEHAVDSRMDPRTALVLVQEYVIARSPQLATTHFLDVQRVANRVWQNHLSHKGEIRGKVVQTFEQLSALTEIMANRMKSVSNSLKVQKENEQFLRESLKRVMGQKKTLEEKLEARNQFVRDYAGVPRRNIPKEKDSSLGRHGKAETQEYVARMVEQALAKTAAELGERPKPNSRPFSASRVTVGRPSSAPVTRARPGSALVATGTKKQLQAKEDSTGGRVFVVSMAGRPTGTHWGKYTSKDFSQDQEPGMDRSAGGLFSGANQAGGLGEVVQLDQEHQEQGQGQEHVDRPVSAMASFVGSTYGAGAKMSPREAASGQVSQETTPRRWVPPERSSIESSFMLRMERTASGR